MTCQSCAKDIKESANFCPFCGSKLISQKSPAPPALSSAREEPASNAPGAETMLVPARCSKSKQPFLIRFSRDKAGWTAQSATPLNEQRLRNPALHASQAQGKLRLATEYPGCPHCGAQLLWVHNGSPCAATMNCLDAADTHATCAWCGQSGNLSKMTAGTLRGSGDR